MKLTEIVRNAIDKSFDEKLFEPDAATKKKYGKKLACFVTLTINGELRGCVGSLEAEKPLWEDVRDNALHAAFDDYRFKPLELEDLPKIHIEVSILTEPQPLPYKDSPDLLDKIDSSMGLILKKDGRKATFLPQVWEQLPDKLDFLEHLSFKAGLDKDAWQTAEFEFYKVKVVEE
jgi:AmmeMemoRadiSam system protein A